MKGLLKPEFFPHFTVSSTYAGTVNYPVETTLGPRIQPDLQLVLLHTGSIQVRIDGISMNLPPGHVALLKPGHEEEFTFAAEEETWHRWIAVNVAKLSGEMRSELAALPDFIPISAEMNQVTDLLLSLQRNEGMKDDAVIRSFGQAAIHLYMMECRSLHALTLIHPSVLAVKAYIHGNYQEELSLKLMAAEGHVSIEHLIRLFHRYEHQTPAQYLWKYRVERGLVLLRNSGLSIAEIAYRCGFKTSHHFARQIKSYTGLSPSNVRHETWGIQASP